MSKGTDRSMVLTIFRTENPPFSPLAITARLYEPPRQTKALPVSNRLVAATPMGRFGRPEELNGALMFLLNNQAAGFITGVVLPVDGGFSAYSGV